MDALAKLLPDHLHHRFIFRRITLKGTGRTRKSKITVQRQQFQHTQLTQKAHAKYVTYTIFTANLTTHPSEIDHIYLMGAIQNTVLQKLLYPDWGMIIYVDASSWTVYPELYEKYFVPILKHYPETYVIEVDWRTQLTPAVAKKIVHKFGKQVTRYHNHQGWDLALVAAQGGHKGNLPIQYGKTMYRFFPGGSHVTFITRDADARLSAREAVAMDEWLHTNVPFSRIFDNSAHANPFLAGNWGAKTICHNVLKYSNQFGSCKSGDVPLPGIIEKVISFVSDRNTMLRGYGIDELFMGTIDDRLSHEYYENVITYGTGSYYSGSVVFSFFTDRQALKIGHRMMTLMPAKGPDDLAGSHQGLSNFEEKKEIPVLGRQVYFMNEDLPVRKEVPPEVIDWLIHWTIHYRSAKREDMKPAALEKQFKKFHIQINPSKLSHDLKSLSLEEFQHVYQWDKRVLPHFWYTLLTGTNENVPFFEAYNSFNPNDYEIRVFETANRNAFMDHVKLRDHLLETVNTDQYVDIRDKVLKLLNSGRGRVIRGSINLTPFFLSVRKYVLSHSRVYSMLTNDEKHNYWYTMANAYPFTALRQFNLDF